MTGPSYGADGTITYHFGAIMDVTTAIATYTGAVEGSLEDLYQEFTRLFAADWHGAAGQAVDAAQTQWNQGADEIRNALAQVGVKLGASAERMQALDKQIAANI